MLTSISGRTLSAQGDPGRAQCVVLKGGDSSLTMSRFPVLIFPSPHLCLLAGAAQGGEARASLPAGIPGHPAPLWGTSVKFTKCFLREKQPMRKMSLHAPARGRFTHRAQVLDLMPHFSMHVTQEAIWGGNKWKHG